MWGVTMSEANLSKSNKVSIHTPVWGVTTHFFKGFLKVVVSIHTPVWGVTFFRLHNLIVLKCFNPHARVGRDFGRLFLTTLVKVVSIHTPVWGVTFTGITC